MVEQNPTHPEPQPLIVTESAGKILSSERMAWDLSVEEVASNLNLSVDTINALERDEYDRLPGYTFVKGYIRSYANLLRLNPDDIISKVDLKPERLSEIPTSRAALKLKSGTRGQAKKSSGLFFKTIITIVLLAVMTLFGLNQLSNLDTDKLAKFLKLPTSEKSESSADGGNDIVFPVIDNSAEKSAGTDSNGKKEALIRIE